MDRNDENSEVDDQVPALQADPHILKNPDLLIWSEPGRAEGTDGNLPPRIAERLQRYASTKMHQRRTSAASSRRNSLSSQHSHRSSRSRRHSHGHQSNSIAQHLRRASIIEDRKARLADRAAHVEQVRLRAALAKATPRPTVGEERFAAAQKAREQYLAKVAATCAEEVSRAKRVAEENKERKAAEERKSRLELAEKHAEAERRRLEYKRAQRKPRASSSANNDNSRLRDQPKQTVTEESASIIIQRAWRRFTRRKVIQEYTQLELSIDKIHSVTFDEATEILANARIVSAARDLLKMFDLVNSSSEESISARSFLSAFMMLGHPTSIFSKNGSQEQDLMDKAKELLIHLQASISEASNTTSTYVSTASVETLTQAYATYTSAFQAWKAQDASVLIGTMIEQFVELDSIWQSVKSDTAGGVADDYNEGIRNNQVILLAKIKKLAGPERANLLIKKAIRDSRLAKNNRRRAGDVRPRPLAPSEPTPVDQIQQPMTVADASSAIQEQQQTASSQHVKVDEISKLFSIVPPNRVLIHELLINPSYKISVPTQADPRNALNHEVCRQMKKGIEDGHQEAWTVAVAENIRKRLLKLLKPGNSIHKLLSEVLDPEYVRLQCRQNVFSYERFFTFMADLLPKLCAPVRDEEVKILAQTLKGPGGGVDSMIEKLFGLLQMTDTMSLDYTNFVLAQAAPSLIREGESYEQRMFSQDLQSGSITLQRIRRWWRNASVNVLTEAGNNDPQGQINFNKIYSKALIDLAVAPGQLQAEDVPETLQFDHARFCRIRADIIRFTTVGSILLTAKNLLKRDVRSQWKPEARRILDSLKAGYDNDDGDLTARIMAIIELTHGMPHTSRDHLATITTRFLFEARSGRLVDPVLKLLFQRLKCHLFRRVAASGSVERVRVASTASESLAAIGLSEFIGQVGEIAAELSKISSADQAAHGEWYRMIAREVEDMGSEQSAQAMPTT